MIGNRRIVLGVSGGIAAYKAAELCSRLVQAGAIVDVILTAGALHFIQPVTFNALTHRPVVTDPWQPWTESAAGHIALAHNAAAIVIAPATAHTLARLALGLADDALGLVCLASQAPLVLAPAMEANMWRHPATQAHVATLIARGARVVGPEQGRLASGLSGEGRLASPEAIVDALQSALVHNASLAGRIIVVTAGGTHEPIDPVRFIGNRSSGRMGFAVAAAAARRGAAVRLVAGPTQLATPAGVERVDVETAREMLAATQTAVADADALVMAAAVADFRPEVELTRKIKKRPGDEELDLRFIRNPDILATIDRPGLIKIGFAAETDDLIENAERKLRDKHLAMIVANDAVATIGSDASQATLIRAGAAPVALPPLPKDVVAERIIDQLAALLRPRDAAP